ncbi:MAG: branched-chain-amino-acid transaminase [Myxococcota bacterium]|nr:branched-chain-amino-acid transaminase [Myxococcota bacterium]
MAADEQTKVWIGGQIVDAEEARISVFDHGLLYGDGVFEGMRVYGGAIFRLDDHLRRFERGAGVLGIPLPGGLEAVRRAVLETAGAYAKPEAYIRLILTRGRGALGVDPTTCENPQLICIVTRISLYPDEKLARGIDLVTSSLRRPSPDALDPGMKSLNYLNSVLAKREARLRGADEALILNAQGGVAEASVANVFACRNEVLMTPPAAEGALPGITRASVLEIAAELGIETRECALVRMDLISADEVFLTGSGARIVPVASLDGQALGAGVRGPLTERITDAFADFVRHHGTPIA